MKYIKVNTAALGGTPIVFPEAIEHSEFAERLCGGEAQANNHLKSATSATASGWFHLTVDQYRWLSDLTAKMRFFLTLL